MIPEAVSYYGLLFMVRLVESIYLKYYFEVLDQAFFLNVNHLLCDTWTFVQKIAGVHASSYTKSWLDAI